MPESLIYILIFAAIMYFMCGRHGGKDGGGGCCGGHSKNKHSDEKLDRYKNKL